MIKRVIPFIYSANIAYLAEFGDLYVKFYYNDTFIVEIETPYTESEIFEIQVTQIADTMRISHYNHKTRILSRINPSSFSIEEIDFRNGPFMVRNDIVDHLNTNPATMQCTVTEPGDSGILFSSVPIFTDLSVGALFKLVHLRTVTKITRSGSSTVASAVMYAKGTLRFVTEGSWAGTVLIERNENDKGWEIFRTYEVIRSGSRNISESWVEDEFNILYRIRALSGMSSNFAGSLTLIDSLNEGIVRVTEISGPTVCLVEVLARLESTEKTTRWAEGSWSGVRGWPGTITIFEDRIVYAGATNPAAAATGAEFDYPSLQEIVI